MVNTKKFYKREKQLQSYPKKKFRISARKIFLTYSQVNPIITAKQILEILKKKMNFYEVEYLIGKEFHQDGGTHYHVILRKQNKFNITNQDFLDIQYKQKNYHGNYKAVKYLDEAVAYVCKHNDYITNIENIQNGKLLTSKQFIIQQVEQKGMEKALLEHYKKQPEKALADFTSALKKQFNDIEKIKATLQLDEIQTPFTLENFQIPDEIKQWIQNPKKTLVLIGDSAVGKTQFCKAFVKQKNLKTLLVNHKEDFRRINSSYHAIIIDDANIHELEETQLLSLIENQEDKTLRVLYDSVFKKAGIVQMIAMNIAEFQKIAYFLTQKRFARRLLFQEIKTFYFKCSLTD